MRMLLAAIAASLLYGGAASASVLTYNVTMETSGAPNPAVLNFTLDTDAVATGAMQTAGLTVNHLNFAVDSTIVYDNPWLDTGAIILYGAAEKRGVRASSNDFYIAIEDFMSPADAIVIHWSIAQEGQEGWIATATRPTVTVTEGPAPAPIPRDALAGLSSG